MGVTRFPSRADGIADRMSGFIAHLRMNGMKLGVRETGDAMAALALVKATNPAQARQALCSLLVSDAEGWRSFEDLFDAYWFNAGKQHPDSKPSDHITVQSAHPIVWQPHLKDEVETTEESGADDVTPDTGDGDGDGDGRDGQLIATRADNLSRRDLRDLMDEDSLREAEAAARRIARAIRDRRSRRRKQALRGSALDMRRILRASLARGGEPIDLFRRARPPRPMRIVALCDVSGSMTVYARVFLAFLRGLVDSSTTTDAYLFHTRLIRVTDAMRDHDPLRSAARLSLMAEGFGGGTDIAGCLNAFLDGYSAKALNGRTVVVILSDGYCTSDPAALATALCRIRKKARRIVWLNPLKGWKSYAPVAAAIRAATPYLDAHLPANTLAALGALETEFAKL